MNESNDTRDRRDKSRLFCYYKVPEKTEKDGRQNKKKNSDNK